MTAVDKRLMLSLTSLIVKRRGAYVLETEQTSPYRWYGRPAKSMENGKIRLSELQNR